MAAGSLHQNRLPPPHTPNLAFKLKRRFDTCGIDQRPGHNGAFTVLQTVDTVTLARSGIVSANDWSALMEIVHSLCAATEPGSTPILTSKILAINLIRRQETRFKKRISDHPVKTFTGHGEKR
jgi:hypothetical protein